MRQYNIREAITKRRIIPFALAIRAFYIDEGLLPQEYHDNFIQAMDLREMADYKAKFSKHGAEKNIQAAENAIKSAKPLLKNNQ